MYNIVHVPPPTRKPPSAGIHLRSKFLFFSQKIRLFNRWLHMQLNYAL